MVRSNQCPTLLRGDDTLLMVVDMQEPLLRDIWERERVVRNVCILLDAARELRIPVVPTLQNSRRLGGPIPEVGSRLPAQCVPFDKLAFSCCADGAVMSDVQRSGRKQVLICGVETHICVSQTALDLAAQGYQVHVAADAVSSRVESNWCVGLRRMEQTGVQISSTEMALYEILGEGGTPEFKAVLQLVK